VAEAARKRIGLARMQLVHRLGRGHAHGLCGLASERDEFRARRLAAHRAQHVSARRPEEL